MYKGTQSLEYLFYCEMFTLRWNNGELLGFSQLHNCFPFVRTRDE